MRGKKNSSDISLDVVLNCNKKTSGCVTLPKYHIQISQQLQPPKKTFSEQLDFPAPERRTITGTQAEPIPADRRAHRRNEVPRRCPSGAQVPGLMTIRKRENKRTSPGELAHSTQAPLLPSQRMNGICLFANPKHQGG